MLRMARPGAPANVQWLEGGSYDLGPHLGPFRLVTMGRSFHWMDRPDTLRRLDGIVEPDGAVALFHDSHPELPDNAWSAEFRVLVDSYAADDTSRAGRDGPEWVPHVAVLLDSAFSLLEEIAVIERRDAPVEVLVDRALSMSSTSRARLGARADLLAEEIGTLMARLAPSGRFIEVVSTSALIARRPG
jgi:hypothetical protein